MLRSVMTAALVAAMLLGCAAAAARADVAVTHSTVSIPVANTKAHADMYLPASASPVPGVIVFPTYFAMLHHGSEAADRDYAEALAKHGFATLVPVLDERATPYNGGFTVDIPAVAAWFRARPEVMDDRIGAVGFSKGSHDAAVLAGFDATTRAIVGYYGPYDPAKVGAKGEASNGP